MKKERKKYTITPFFIIVPIMFFLLIWFIVVALKDGGGLVLAIPAYAGIQLIAFLLLGIDRFLVKRINVLIIILAELLFIALLGVLIAIN